MKKIVLFDMDGTLTPARKKMTIEMCRKLDELQRHGFEIGIVTGSDMEYLKEQCDLMLGLGPVNASRVHYLPCNGTKYYKMYNNKFQAVYERDMWQEIGDQQFKKLNSLLCSLQNSIATFYDISLAGNYIVYRGSMINWCPIGRSATAANRAQWCFKDRKQEIRKQWLRITRQALNNHDLENVVVKLGGETSFDIYPEGWDKTYAFRNFNDEDTIYFVGDRCQPYVGNDYEAYIHAKNRGNGNGYSTTGPEETIRIIDEIIFNETK
tara:strand:+ start:3219 stop:4016 length:798 start_codon:yes stop_codon:yes gene_type:complete